MLKDKTVYPGLSVLKNEFGHLRGKKYHHLLFRINRFYHPFMITLAGSCDSVAMEFLKAGGEGKQIFQEITATEGHYQMAILDLAQSEARLAGYISNILQHSGEESVLIVWNLRKSHTTLAIWEDLIRDARIKIAIDLCRMGLIYFGSGLSKEDFMIRF